MDAAHSAADAFVRQLFVFRQNATCLVSAEIDRVKLQARSAGLLVLVAALAGVAVASVIVVSVMLIGAGAAQGLTELFGGRQWLGWLAAGELMLLFTTIAAFAAYRLMAAASFEKTRQRYQALRNSHGETRPELVGRGSPSSFSSEIAAARSEEEYLKLQSRSAREGLEQQAAGAVQVMSAHPIMTAMLTAAVAVTASQVLARRTPTPADASAPAEASSDTSSWAASLLSVVDLLKVVAK